MRASDAAYTALQEEILEGSLPPGTVLGEVEQSQRLGVSRTPVREAFSRLVAAGLAVQHPRRGTVVTDISLEDVDRLFEVRIPLESQAASLAAQRGSAEVFTALAEEFDAAQLAPDAESHYRLAARMDQEIDAAVGNPYLSTMLSGLRVHLARVRRLAKDRPDRLARSAAEHRDICLGIASGDPQMAEAATRLHLRRSLGYISQQRQQLSEPEPAT
ncbi:GntR family transcriptional regulator [Nesterenkonia alkaliphila]|uniref:FCD domain-containing protein n=1 Tax=Nesterenkonia alkaliphila TaxID=1463631 RepID=A0A7K1UHL4_9MICC|nr:GntR family transcriptional regulator [Nesterenkonia alkaliphila]MVT25963.1 FCD domain-containing protein [Nesterenkonia alkaliphila]GFZ95674.1 GntR family transcriptional regulator [Nesterenkonia alkaliphila]